MFSNYCGFGGKGIPQHTLDRICRRHDRLYQQMLDNGQNPYLTWNNADDWMVNEMKKHSRDSLREKILGQAINAVWTLKQTFAPNDVTDTEDIDIDDEYETELDEEYSQSVSNLTDSEEDMSGHGENRMAMRSEGSGQKRKKREEHGMEPHGHGNTPATGTEQLNYVEKYVPVAFPDKIVLKLRYCNSYAMRSIVTAGSVATPAYVIWNTNSIFSVDRTTSGVGSVHQFSGHQPNQRDNWSAQYNFYRVESLEYKIHVMNTAQATTTGTTPITWTNAQANNDAIVSLIKTQTSTDISATSNTASWELKMANNRILRSAAGSAYANSTVYEGTVEPEDFDLDITTTAQDETWTAVGSNPVITRLMGLKVEPLSPENETGHLPEVGLNVFIDFMYTVQFAGYSAALRQTAS